jgi:hypothetical protein
MFFNFVKIPNFRLFRLVSVNCVEFAKKHFERFLIQGCELESILDWFGSALFIFGDKNW